MKGDLVSTKHARVSILALALVVGGCTGATGGTPSTAPVAVGTLAATSVPAATTTTAPATSPEPSLGGGPQPTAGPIDPCTLLTAGEASTLMGKTLGAGVESTVNQNKVCTFKSDLSEVKVILAPPAPDVATATQYWDAARAEAPAEVTIDDISISGFDRAAYGNGTSAGAPVSALFLIKGTHFLDLYCGFPACSETADAAAAVIIAGRLP
jgi:uncharacterized protein DUF3558